jgi:hypothetical protein
MLSSSSGADPLGLSRPALPLLVLLLSRPALLTPPCCPGSPEACRCHTVSKMRQQELQQLEQARVLQVPACIAACGRSVCHFFGAGGLKPATLSVKALLEACSPPTTVCAAPAPSLHSLAALLLASLGVLLQLYTCCPAASHTSECADAAARCSAVMMMLSRAYKDRYTQTTAHRQLGAPNTPAAQQADQPAATVAPNFVMR